MLVQSVLRVWFACLLFVPLFVCASLALEALSVHPVVTGTQVHAPTQMRKLAHIGHGAGRRIEAPIGVCASRERHSAGLTSSLPYLDNNISTCGYSVLGILDSMVSVIS